MEQLRDKGALVSYSDPHVPRFIKMRKHDFDLESVALTAETSPPPTGSCSPPTTTGSTTI